LRQNCSFPIGKTCYGARYYNPVIGRFITPDTYVQDPENPQTLNRYSYCGNNPVNRIDPSGHSWFSEFFGKIIGAIAGTIAGLMTGNFMVGFQVFNLINSAFTAGMTGNWGGFVGGLAGGILGGMVGVGWAANVAGWLGEASKTFMGGFLIGAVEFGVAGFGAGLGGALGLGADFRDAMLSGAIGLGTGAVIGGIIEGTYLSGMQNFAHGLDKETVQNEIAAYRAKLSKINEIKIQKASTDIYGEGVSAKAEASFTAEEFSTTSPYSKATISLDKAKISGKVGPTGVKLEASAQVIEGATTVKIGSIGDTQISVHSSAGWGAKAKAAFIVDYKSGKGDVGFGVGVGPTAELRLIWKNKNR
jgi:RHS repeat-associated protein